MATRTQLVARRRSWRTSWLKPWRALLVLPALLLAAGCGVTTGTAQTGTTPAPTFAPTATPTPKPTPTPTPVPTCASALHGAGKINLAAAGFVYPYLFPTNSVGTAPSTTASGTGLFSVHQLDVCSPGTSVSGAQSFFETQLPALPHGWITSTTFPADGGLMRACAAPCFWDPKGGPFYYFVFDSFKDHGAGVVTYRVRWAASPDFPSCGSNFTGGAPAVQNVFFVPNFSPQVPVPPISSLVPDDAAGGVRGYDVCSPGDPTSVSAFMTKELAATGWTQVGANAACVFTSQCWTQGSAVISWDAGSDATDWHLGWRQ